MKVKDLIHFINDCPEYEIEFIYEKLHLDMRFIGVDPDRNITTILLVSPQKDFQEVI